MDAEIIDSFARLLERLVTPRAVRAAERGEEVAGMWAGFAGSGFLDILVGESAGGAGFALEEVAPLLEMLGAAAVPLPVAETMVARALLAEGGVAVPPTPLLLLSLPAGFAPTAEIVVPALGVARHALLARGTELVLVEVSGEPGLYGCLSGEPLAVAPGIGVPVELPCGLDGVAALLRAAAIAGAGGRALEMTLSHVATRQQFGRPVGRQQAVQQNLAVMAEEVVKARLAARLGLAGGFAAPRGAVAAAKCVASRAARQIADRAHAAHGAIGISEEYDLQLLTRRLRLWAEVDGGAGWWAESLGRAFVAGEAAGVDFARSLGRT